MLQELALRYGLSSELGKEISIPNRLELLREHIRKEIRKELKIKEGAENLKKVTSGKTGDDPF